MSNVTLSSHLPEQFYNAVILPEVETTLAKIEKEPKYDISRNRWYTINKSKSLEDTPIKSLSSGILFSKNGKLDLNTLGSKKYIKFYDACCASCALRATKKEEFMLGEQENQSVAVLLNTEAVSKTLSRGELLDKVRDLSLKVLNQMKNPPLELDKDFQPYYLSIRMAIEEEKDPRDLFVRGEKPDVDNKGQKLVL